MIIIIHRWQSNRKNFNNQKIELSESVELTDGSTNELVTYWSAAFDARMVQKDAGDKNFRTQKVDRIEVDTFKGEVHIYTSAVVERKHAPKKSKGDSVEVYKPSHKWTPDLPPRANSVPIETLQDLERRAIRCILCDLPLSICKCQETK